MKRIINVFLFILLVAGSIGFYYVYDFYQKDCDKIEKTKVEITNTENLIKEKEAEIAQLSESLEQVKEENKDLVEEYELWNRKTEDLLAKLSH